MRRESEKAGSQTRFPGTISTGPAKSQLNGHRVRHLLVDGMVELRNTLVRPVFAQLRKNLSQSVRPERVETVGGVRNQARRAEHLPVNETPASVTAAAAGGREGAWGVVTAHKAASLVCVCTSQGHHPGASESATRPKGRPFTLSIHNHTASSSLTATASIFSSPCQNLETE